MGRSHAAVVTREMRGDGKPPRPHQERRVNLEGDDPIEVLKRLLDTRPKAERPDPLTQEPDSGPRLLRYPHKALTA